VPKLEQLNSLGFMCSLNLVLNKKDLIKMELLLLENGSAGGAPCRSVERNAGNMYEARKFLLGLENSGVSSSSTSVAVSPSSSSSSSSNSNGPSIICPVGLEILTSAGLGLSTLGNFMLFCYIG
jgi:hypothetical protein